MVKMAKAKIEKTIRELPIGESTWTVPWALYLDGDQECWLNGAYTQHAIPGGTVQMKVTHTAAGYVCDITRCDYKWSEGSGVAAWGDPIRILKLTDVRSDAE